MNHTVNSLSENVSMTGCSVMRETAYRRATLLGALGVRASCLTTLVTWRAFFGRVALSFAGMATKQHARAELIAAVPILARTAPS